MRITTRWYHWRPGRQNRIAIAAALTGARSTHWRENTNAMTVHVHRFIIALTLLTLGAAPAEDPPEDVRRATEAIAAGPDDPARYAARAAAYERRRDFAKAVADYDKVIELS